MNNRVKRKIFCEEMLSAIKPINPRPKEWSYTTSIEYMLQSKKYMDSFACDIDAVVRDIKNDPRANLKVLDFGTGSGVAASCLRRFCQLENICKDIEITGVDTDRSKTIKKDEEEKYFYDIFDHQENIWRELSGKFDVDFRHYFDISEFLNQNNRYDIIIMYAVYEHIPKNEIDGIMAVLKKILCKDGKIYMFKLPRKLAYMEYLAGLLKMGNHEIRFGDMEIKKALNEQNFTVIKRWYSDLFPSFPFGAANFLYWPLFLLEAIFRYTPMIYISHNNNLIIKNK